MKYSSLLMIPCIIGTVYSFWVTETAHPTVPTFKGLNGKELIITLTGNEIKVCAADDQKRTMVFDDDKIVFVKSFRSRGFYIQVPNQTFSSLYLNKLTPPQYYVLEFDNYDEEPIEQFDYYWKSQPDNLEMKANYVRGARTMSITQLKTIAEEGQEAVQIHIFEQMWIMKAIPATFIILICLAHLVLNLYYLNQFAPEWTFGRQFITLFVKINEEEPNQKLIDLDSQRRQKLLWKFRVKCFLHVLDLFSDLYYFFTVPSYIWVFKYGIIFFMLPPIVLILKNNVYCGGIYTFQQSLLIFFGARPLYQLWYNEGDMHDLADHQMDVSDIFIYEDGPQFFLQMINTMLIGQSFTWVQIVSPFLSLRSIAYRYFQTGREQRDLIFKNALQVNFYCVLPVLISILCLFVYKDQRPQWAQQFSMIRWNLEEEKEYPFVNPFGLSQ